jgi:2-methylisocitrate lyase-like PEP mutase family enzyme
MSAAAQLREMMGAPGMVVAPGAYDGITARLVERAGFKAAYMTGAGVAAARGYPDYGLTTLSEMSASVGLITEAVSIPLIADGDTGFGNELNIVRSVREYARNGAAAIQIEDQTFPKRCGHLDNKELVSAEEFTRKVRAAAYARKGADIIIVARTDARAVCGLEEAIRRGNLALDAGADVVFVEAPQSVDEIKAVPKSVRGACLFNMVRGGKTPSIGTGEVEAFGYRITIVPGISLVAAIGACEQALEGLKQERQIPEPPREMTVVEMFRRAGLEEWDVHRKAVS